MTTTATEPVAAGSIATVQQRCCPKVPSSFLLHPLPSPTSVHRRSLLPPPDKLWLPSLVVVDTYPAGLFARGRPKNAALVGSSGASSTTCCLATADDRCQCRPGTPRHSPVPPRPTTTEVELGLLLSASFSSSPSCHRHCFLIRQDTRADATAEFLACHHDHVDLLLPWLCLTGPAPPPLLFGCWQQSTVAVHHCVVAGRPSYTS